MIKWLTVILIVAISLFASGWMLESLGVIDIESGVMSALERVPGLSHRIAIYKVGLEADRILSRSARELSELHAELAESRRRMEEERAAYQAARERIDSEWAALEQLRRQLDVKEASLAALSQNVADLDRLRAVYGEMRAREVAPIIDEFDDATAARILGGMASDVVADILAELPPARAARLSKMIGGVSTK